MGSVGKVENLEEVLAPTQEVYSVLTDINLAQMWGRTQVGSIIYPQDPRMKLGQLIDMTPKGMKDPLKLKITLMHHGEFVELEIIDGPMFGMLKFEVETRPYGTLLTSTLDYRIENMGFNLKWKFGERNKYKSMMEGVLANIKNLSEQRNIQ
jgi:hypothetical protein